MVSSEKNIKKEIESIVDSISNILLPQDYSVNVNRIGYVTSERRFASVLGRLLLHN